MSINRAVKRKVVGVAKRCRIERNVEIQARAVDSSESWGLRHFAKFGDRAARMAAVCRREGFRDLVVPIEKVAEILPTLAGQVEGVGTVYCTHGMVRRSGTPLTTFRAKRCGSEACCAVITDSGHVSFYCLEHAETAVVRMPRQC
jgi:hypothetical protein